MDGRIMARVLARIAADHISFHRARLARVGRADSPVR